MIGKQVKQKNLPRVVGSGIRGPLSKEKRISLKLARNVSENVVYKDKCAEEKDRGITRNRTRTGKIESNRGTPDLILVAM